MEEFCLLTLRNFEITVQKLIICLQQIIKYPTGNSKLIYFKVINLTLLL